MKRSELNIVFLSLLTVSGCLSVSAQKKKDKNYAEGYIIRLSDTIPCKIYTGYQQEEIGYEMTFKYDDGRILTYNPGSVIKGFGYKKNKEYIHFHEVDVPVYIIREQENNKAYAEVITDGALRLYKFRRIKNSVFIASGAIPAAILYWIKSKENELFSIKKKRDDSLYVIGQKTIIGTTLFERNEIVPFLAGYPQVMANEHDELISLKDLKKYLQEYNTWYRRKKEQVTGNTDN